MKPMPPRCPRRASPCTLPLSPTALRTALMRLVSVDPETTRPFQIASIRSSLLSTRSRLRQMDQQVEYLRLHGDAPAAAAQLAPLHVKDLIIKEKLRPGQSTKRRSSRNNQ